jgi:hypothetical protein
MHILVANPTVTWEQLYHKQYKKQTLWNEPFLSHFLMGQKSFIIWGHNDPIRLVISPSHRNKLSKNNKIITKENICHKISMHTKLKLQVWLHFVTRIKISIVKVCHSNYTIRKHTHPDKDHIKILADTNYTQLRLPLIEMNIMIHKCVIVKLFSLLDHRGLYLDTIFKM